MKSTIGMTDCIDMRYEDHYEDFLSGLRRNFSQLVSENDCPLFLTNAGNLFDLFLNGLPEEARQHYNCHCCRHFMKRFGGIVTVREDGSRVSVMWNENDVPEFFRQAVANVGHAVKNARITGVFLSDQEELGTAVTGSLHHMAVQVPFGRIFSSRAETALQAAAATDEEHRLLRDCLLHYERNTLTQAVHLLRSDELFRSEKILGCAQWLLNVRDNLETAVGRQRRCDLLWRYAATAPVGFCHVRSGVLGTLLDDIESGKALTAIQARFQDKMDSAKYQRPSAAPSSANVHEAEKLVEQLGLARSLDRRFARLEEIPKLWTPRKQVSVQPVRRGVFDSVVTSDQRSAKTVVNLIPSVTMTWSKFLRTVLPDAVKIEYEVEDRRQSFSAIVTAMDESAPPIIQWDSQHKRNPFSWYLHSKGSNPEDWDLQSGYCEVTGIAYQPNMWNGGFEHFGEGVLFILKGAKDMNSSGNALFPEILRSELHSVRATIEAYASDATLSGLQDASACGILLQNGRSWNARFRVVSETGTTIYTLDRWD